MPAKLPRTRSIGRRRRTLGLTLLALGTLIAALWAFSGWWRTGYYFDNGKSAVQLESGYLIYLGNVGPFRGDPDGFYVWAAAGRGLLQRFTWWQGVGYMNEKSIFISFQFGVGSYVSAASSSNFVTAFLLLWPFPLVVWAAGGVCLRSSILARRRALASKCKSCNYDLTGLAAGAACPECGKGAAGTEKPPREHERQTTGAS
jgi:hypothetical protein